MTKRQPQPQLTLISALLLGGVFAAQTHAQCPPKFEVTAILQGPDCGLPGVAAMQPYGLNDLGQITGCSSCLFYDQKAWVWWGDGPYEYIPLPAGVTGITCGVDLTNDGLVLGQIDVSGDAYGSIGFTYDGKTSTLLPGPPPGGYIAETFNMDESGDRIVGEWRGNGGKPSRAALLWQNSEMVLINEILGTPNSEANDVNDKGWITGWMGAGGPTVDARAFILDGTKVADLGIIDGATSVVPEAINNNGAVAGTAWFWDDPVLANRTKHAFLWQDGEFTDLGVLPPWERTLGKDINDWGWVIGDLTDAPFGSGVPTEAAFLWIDGQMWRLNDLVEGPNPPQLDFAMAVNNKGQILCQGRYAGNSAVAILISPINRPDTDLNDDCVTNVLDLIAFLGLWGDTGGAPNPADFNNDQTVNVLDLLILLGQWGS